MNMEILDSSSVKPVSVGAIAKAAVIGIGISVVGNVILYLTASALGAMPESVVLPNAGEPITLVPVVLSSIVPLIIASLLYWLLVRFTKKPDLIFCIISGVILVLWAFTPFSIPNAPFNMILTLELMHVVAGGAIVFALTQLTKKLD
jgi:hypothetical protein